MARYDLSVSPHSLATFTNSTGFPAKLENSTRRPDSAVAWNSCNCIDAGAVVFSLIVKLARPRVSSLALNVLIVLREERIRKNCRNQHS